VFDLTTRVKMADFEFGTGEFKSSVRNSANTPEVYRGAAASEKMLNSSFERAIAAHDSNREREEA
jgi:hypothetical protein